MFKGIDGQLTTVFDKVQKINTGFGSTKEEIEDIIKEFNTFNQEQNTSSLIDFYDNIASKNTNVANMFQNIAKQGATATASVKDFYAAILDGNTTGFRNVQSVIETFNSVDPSHQQEFAKAVGQTNRNLGTYLSNVEVGSASMKGYGNQLVATTAKTISLKVATAALNAVISLGITAAISGLIIVVSKAISWLWDLTVTHNKLRESVEETVSSYKEAQKTMQDTGKQLDDLTDKYKKLSKGVDSLNNNVSLSSAEYSDYLDICNDIGDMFPNLIQGYDDQGNAILKCKDNVELLIEAYREAQIAANNVIINNGKDVFKDFKNEADDIKGYSIKYILSDGKDLTKQAVDSLESIINSPDIDKAVRKYARAGTTMAVQIVEALKEHGINQDKSENVEEFIARAVKENKVIVSSIVSEFNKTVDDATSQMKSLSEAYVSNLMLTDNDYKNLTTSTKSMINSVISSLDFDFYNQFEKGDYESVITAIEGIVNEFKNLSVSDRTKIEIGLNAKAQLNNGDCTVQEYLDKVAEAKQVIENLDENSKATLNLMLNDNDISNKISIISNRLSQNDFEYTLKASDSDNTIENLSDRLSELTYRELEIAYDLIQNNTFSSWEEFMDAVKNGVVIQTTVEFNFQTEIDKFKDVISNSDLFKEAIEKINNKETISFDDMTKMVALDENLSGKFKKTTEGYTIAVNELVKARQNYTKETRESLEAQIQSAKQSIKVTEDSISELQAKRDEFAKHINSKSDYELLQNYDKEIEAEKQKLNGFNNTLSETQLILGEVDTAIISNTSCLEKSQNAISNMESKTTLLKTALTEMRDAGSISADTYAELAEKGEDYVNCLEIQNGKLVLNTQKLKDLDTAALKTAITTNELAMAQINASMSGHEWSEALKEEYKNIELATAALRDKLNEYNNTQPDDKKDSSSSSKSEKPQSVLDFEEELSRRQHEIKMGRMEEDEDYFNWLESAYKKAYEGVEDCQDDLYKYEEEVYQGRKKLAEEDFNNKHEQFEKYVDYLKEYADELSETSITSDGTKLNTQEKFREIAAVYTDIQSAIQREMNRIVQVGVEGNEELLEELEKQLKEYADKVTDTFKSAVETEKSLLENQKSSLSDVYDKEIDKIKKQQEDSKNAADAEIDLIQEKIDNLKKVNDEKQSEYEIEKAKQDLEKAGQRTRMTYGSDGTIIYKQDDEKIKEAQQNLDKLLLEKQVNSLESQKSVLENMRDKESESYDKLIEDIESQKEQDERQFDILIQRLDDYLNPNSDTSNSDVWSEIAKMDGASYRNGKWIDKDGTEIDVAALLSKVDKVADNNDKTDNNVKTSNVKTGNNTNTDKVDNQLKTATKTDLKEILKSIGISESIAQSLTSEKLSQIFGLSSVKPNATIINQPDVSKWTTQAQTQRNNNNNSQPVNMTFGDIVIQNPVGDAKKLAQEVKGEIFKEAMMQIPNVAMKQIHTNLR